MISKPVNLSKNKLRHLIFWGCVFVFSMASSSWYYASFKELFEVNFFRLSLQILLAYSVIKILIPNFLNKKKGLFFGLSLFVTLAVVNAICTSYLVYYLAPTYPESFANYLKRFTSTDFLGIYLNWSQFISKSLHYLYPTLILAAISFYAEKQKLLELHEKKREAELNALKNQLNPHFLFNTLNSLYLLALKKSDKTIKVIENLSHILDYMLYRCDKKFVLLTDELNLINKYIELEQIRYGKRVNINYDESITGSEKIAPLLLLTFVENAFKHGVSEEIKTATINIQVKNIGNQFSFEIKNSKPLTGEKIKERKSLGLLNVKKQLELLYPKSHELNITDATNTYFTQLKLSL